MPVHLENETELLAAARKGDTEAFTTLANQYNRNIYRLAFNITRNNEDAEDVMQEAFFKAYTKLDKFQGNSRFYTWLVRIAVNEALMKLRKRKSDRTVSMDEPVETDVSEIVREVKDWGDNPEQTYAKTELQEMLSEAIETLEPAYRTVFVLRDVEDLSTEETAESLGLSVPAVKSRLLRARLKLREQLTRQFQRGHKREL
jgi:RNA polymerase sigma-70 factor (ECF subfamily)